MKCFISSSSRDDDDMRARAFRVEACSEYERFFSKYALKTPHTYTTKVKEKGSRSDASQLASDDLDWAPLTSPFSVDSPLTLDLKVRASVSKLVDGFLSSYHSKKVDSKYSSLVTRVRRPRLGTNNQSLQCGFAQCSGSQTQKASDRFQFSGSSLYS